jgi:hypothetical protein
MRRRVEEIIGWIKVVGGLRCSRYRGQERTQAWRYFVAGTCNLLRLARLELASAMLNGLGQAGSIRFEPLGGLSVLTRSPHWFQFQLVQKSLKTYKFQFNLNE